MVDVRSVLVMGGDAEGLMPCKGRERLERR